jgi:hypothetical protein
MEYLSIVIKIYRIMGILFSIKTVSNTNSPLFCLSVIYIQKSLIRWKKYFFGSYRKDFGSKLYLFPFKNYSFLGLLFFLAYFGLWRVIHSNRARYIFSWTMNVTSQGVIFTVPQICAYFVDNPHNLEIDLFKIAVNEHILLYFKNSNSFFCVHMKMCGTRVCCVSSHGIHSFSTGKHSTYFHRICVCIHILR